MPQNTTVITIDVIKRNITTNPRWMERALVVLYERQTPTEQEAESTGIHNGRGFNAVDAPLLSSFAKQILRSGRPAGQRLSEKQRAWAAKKLGKYARQLLEEAMEKGGAK